jgi:predicted deacetylase
MPPHRLLASIHDVGPRFESEVDRLVDLLRLHVGNRIALLVVPNRWGESPILPGSPFASRLREWAETGFEIFLHGYFHRDAALHDRSADRLRARWMTAGEGEFLGLSRDEARSRIDGGRCLIESITGQPVAGFIAPAWLYGRGALEALGDCKIPIAEDHWRVWSPASGRVLSRSPVITWASRTAARRRTSLLAAAVLRNAPVRDLRVGAHPPDCHSPLLLKSIDRTLAVATRSRQPAAYSELLDTRGA